MSAIEVPASFLLHALAAGMTQEEIDLVVRLQDTIPFVYNAKLCWSPQALRVNHEYIMPSRRTPVMGFQPSHLALIHWADLLEMRWTRRPVVLYDPREGWITDPFIAERVYG